MNAETMSNRQLYYEVIDIASGESCINSGDFIYKALKEELEKRLKEEWF